MLVFRTQVRLLKFQQSLNEETVRKEWGLQLDGCMDKICCGTSKVPLSFLCFDGDTGEWLNGLMAIRQQVAKGSNDLKLGSI